MLEAQEHPQSHQIFGRETELSRLQQCLGTVLAGKHQIVFITGEPGIGKTTLVDTLLARLPSNTPLAVGYGQCIEQYGAGEAYLPILEAVGQLCQTSENEQLVEALRQRAPTWLVQLSALIDSDEREALQRQLQGTTKERMLREAAELMTLLTKQHPVILVLEDLHWCDVSTLEWITYIAQRREPLPFLLIGTYRPADVVASEHPLRGVVQELQAKGQSQEIPLTPLSESAIGEYLASRFAQAALPEQVSQAIHQRTGGNPLFMVNVLDYLTDQGLFQTDVQGILSSDVQALEGDVPQNLRHLIERQLERLEDEKQRLLEVASVVGAEFAVEAVAAGLKTDADLLEEASEVLTHRGQVIESSGIAEWADGTLSGQYRFRHALYKQVLYERVVEVRRARLHRAIAERLEAGYGAQAQEHAGELALHFEQGRAAAKAVQYYLHAGEAALQQNAHQEAIYHLTKGLALVQTLPETQERAQQELALQISYGVALIATKGFAAPEVEQAYTRARSLCQHITDAETLFPVLYGLWNFYLVRLELGMAEELANQMFTLAEQQDDVSFSLIAYNAQGQTAFQQGRITTAQQCLAQGLSLYDPQQHHALAFVYGEDLGISSQVFAAWASWYVGYPDQARTQVEDMIRLARKLNHPFSLAQTLTFGGHVHLWRREAAQVQQHAQPLISLCHEHTFSMWLADGTMQLGWAMAEHGQPEEGAAQISQASTDWRETGAKILNTYHLALQAEVLGKSGHIAQGLSCLTQALQLIEDTDERFYEAEVLRLKGELLLLNDEFRTLNDERQKKTIQTSSVQRSSFITHRFAEAEECFQQAIHVAQQQQAKSLELRAAVSLSKLWHAQGRTAEARQLLEDIYGWFTEGFETRDLQEAETLIRTLGGRVEQNRVAPSTPPTAQAPAPTAKQLVQDSSPTIVPPAPATPAEQPSTNQTEPAAPSALSDTSDYIFRKEGEYWTLGFEGTLCRVKDLRGIQFLAQLIHHPNTEIHALTLFSGEAPATSTTAQHSPQADTVQLPTDAGEALDPQARAAYKQRLEELQAELTEAEEFNDLGRVEQLQAEITFLTQELAQAVGLGGRARKVRSPIERARTNVTKSIKNALKRIADSHPALGEHLRQTIRTGTFCVYAPDPRLPLHWQS